MSLPDVFQERDLETRARGVLGEVRDLGVDTLVPAATDRLRDLAGQIRPERYRKQVNELEGDFSKRVRKLERKLERKVKKLPVDTPLDRRRRRVCQRVTRAAPRRHQASARRSRSLPNVSAICDDGAKPSRGSHSPASSPGPNP